MNFKISNIPGNSVYIKDKKLSEILGQRPNFVLNHGFSPKKIVFTWNQFHISQFLSSASREVQLCTNHAAHNFIRTDKAQNSTFIPGL